MAKPSVLITVEYVIHGSCINNVRFYIGKLFLYRSLVDMTEIF